MPELNAALNLTSALFLIAGFIFIKRRSIAAHKFCMLSATATSLVFLISYIYYHLNHGSTRFQGTGFSRTVYFSILISHTILAVVQVPLIYKTLRHALTGRIEQHRRLAQITLPIWIYVSITGVVIYWMLYQFKYS